MADVEKTPETTIVTKTVESKVADGAVKTEEATTVVKVDNAAEVNGIHEETPATSTEVKPDVEKVEVTEVKQDGQQEKSDVAKEVPDAADKTAKVDTGETEGNTEVVVEEKKDEVPAKVILYQFPPGKHIPNASPFCLKLETYLRIQKIPYDNQYGYKSGKKGKLPWIEYKGERKTDSNLIINYLNEKFEVDLDKDFTSEQLALGRVTRAMLEENTYWALVYNRYIDNFNEFKKCIAPLSGSGIGFSISQKLYQGKMRTNLDGHGLGRHTKEEVYGIAVEDLKAVSCLLEDKPFLLGESPSSFDCAVFGLCANLLYAGVESPMSTYIKENATNLSAFCERMKGAYWPDWADVVLGEKAEPASKQGKEGNGPAEDASAEDSAPAAEQKTSSDEKSVENTAAESPAEKPEPANENKTEQVTASKQETPVETKPDKKE